MFEVCVRRLIGETRVGNKALSRHLEKIGDRCSQFPESVLVFKSERDAVNAKLVDFSELVLAALEKVLGFEEREGKEQDKQDSEVLPSLPGAGY